MSASRRRAPRDRFEPRWNQVQGEMKNTNRSGRYRCVARTKSSSRWRTSTRSIWINLARTRNRISVQPSAWHLLRWHLQGGGALLHEPQARVDAIELLARGVHTAQEMFGLGPRHQIAAFVRQVLGDVAHRGPGGGAGPPGSSAHAAHRQVCATAAEKLRHAGLDVG